MMRARDLYGGLISLALVVLASSASAADTDRTYTGDWRPSDDVVQGWDWSLPAGVRPATPSGIFNLNSRVPADFPGNHLKQVNAKWSELEPVEGKYDFSSITRELNDRNYAGIVLNIRGMVVSIEDANGNPALANEITAPEWLSRSVPKVKEALKNGYRITNMQVYDPTVKKKLLQLIQAFGSTGIPGDPRLVAQIIHGVSSSRGEECCASQNNSQAVEDAMEGIINAWAVAYGRNAGKLAWLKEDPARLFNAAVVAGGTGIRGGIIENWLRGQYTPGDSRMTGQIYDNGYLLVDDSFAPIAERRTFLDENEALIRKFTSPERLQQNYRMATLRMLQMRRNVAWTERDSVVNPPLLNWLSLELGKTVRTAPDAWVVLMRSWTRSGGDKEVKNLERWLYQRDINGVMTTPTLRRDHSYNVTGNDLLDSSKWYVDLARMADVIGIAIDDRFLSGGPHRVAIKVTYLDADSAQWTIEYAKPDGSRGVRKVSGRGDDTVRTATFFIDDLMADRQGMDFDFSLRSSSGKTPFMFVRIIRLDAGEAAAPRPPDSISVN